MRSEQDTPPRRLRWRRPEVLPLGDGPVRCSSGCAVGEDATTCENGNTAGHDCSFGNLD